MLNTTSNTLESQWLTVMKFIYSVVVAALESRLFNYGLVTARLMFLWCYLSGNGSDLR